MTDRWSGLVVVLETDMRDDDAAQLVNAIGQLRGVMNVLPVVSRPGLEMVVKQRLREKLERRMHDAIWGEDGVDE